MISSSDAFEKDACPVGDDLLGHMYRSSEQGLGALVESVPPQTRAMLALFCYKRSHLHDMAIAIASSCEHRDLVEWGGALGSVLFKMSRHVLPKPPVVHANTRRKITLSTKPLSSFTPLNHDVDDETDAEAVAEAVSA